MRGSAELAEQVFDLPVKIGYPRGLRSGLTDIIDNPAFATVLGLILYGVESSDDTGQYLRRDKAGVFKGMAINLKKWIKDFI